MEKKGRKRAAVTSQDSVFNIERRHTRMFTSSSSTRSSPQDWNLISGWPTGHDADWRNSVDGFHWNVSHVFSSWTVTLVPRRAGSDVARGWGLQELVCWPTRGAHLLWQPVPSLQRKRTAVSHSTAFVYDPWSSRWHQQWAAEGKFPYRTNKYCVSGDCILTVCDSELFRFKDRVKKKTKHEQLLLWNIFLITSAALYFCFLNESTREGSH